MQAVEGRLLSNLPSMLEGMADPKLELTTIVRLAREPAHKARQRQDLQRALGIMNTCLSVCKEYSVQ